MIILTEKKSPLKEAGDRVVTSFEVNYWGVKVTYSIYQTSAGSIYYRAEDRGDSKAAKILANKAQELFIAAQKKAGITPVFQAGGLTAEGFIPTQTEFKP
jgi:hypothetical protein